MKRTSTRRTANPTRYAREMGKRLPRWREKLAQYEAEGGYYVHFSEYPNTGVYPTNQFNTPTGYYAYPLSFEKGRIENFGIDRRYAIIFKPARARLWVLRGYTPADYSRDLKILHDALGSFQVTEWKKEARVQTPAGQMWNITRMLAQKNVAKWMRIIYEILGYDGVIDDCQAIIHPNEDCQAVFFDMRTGLPGSPKTEKVRIVDVLEKSRSANLRTQKGIDFEGRDLTDKNLRRVDLRNANLIRAYLYSVDLRGMDLSGANLTGANLTGANLTGANLTGANLTGANLRGAELTSAILREAYLTDARLRVTNLTDAKLDDAHLERVDLTKANLTRADLYKANLARANLFEATFYRASLSYADLTRANLTGANLLDASLLAANLTGADLTGADLTRARLSYANLTDADLLYAKLEGAIWDDTTTWPEGFKPTADRFR